MSKMGEIAADMSALGIEPFNALAAYQNERAYSRKVEKTLSAALSLLGMECSRRELRGEDVSHIRTFISEASQ